MWQNTKLLVTLCFLIIFAGIGALWYGLNPRLQQISSEATDSTSQFGPELTAEGLTANNPGVVGIEGQQALVTKVIDGDTFEIESGKTVRMLGVDTPETVDPRRPVGCFGKEASNKTKSLIDGKTVILQKDVSETDKYERLLRYVFLPLDPSTGSGQLLFVNDYLIREGFAKVLTYPPDVKYAQTFLEAQREAKENKRGLWGRC